MNEIERHEDFYGYDYEEYPVFETDKILSNDTDTDHFDELGLPMDWIVGDFETSNSDINIREEYTRVWLWDVYDHNTREHQNGNDIESFFDYLFLRRKSVIIYFHNLKFDGTFILNYLLSHGFIIDEEHTHKHKTISTLITDRLVWYTFTVYFCGRKYVFRDSLKKIVGTLENAAVSFNLPIRKGSIDYKAHRDEGYIPTPEEIEYAHIDTEIMSDILIYYYENGMTSVTNASDAMKAYKKIIGERTYKYLFPVLDKEIDDFIRASYKGGYCYLNPDFAAKNLAKVYTYDVKSMYPSVMAYANLPYGVPMWYSGEYVYDPSMPLFIQEIIVDCTLKEGHVPSIQTKSFMSIKLNYLRDTEGLEIRLVLTSLDLANLFEDYDIHSIIFTQGYKFASSADLFKEYVSYYYEKKEASKGAMKQLYKIFLNSLYGKFAMMTERAQAIPAFSVIDEATHFEKTEMEIVDATYTAVASFITATARHRLLKAIRENRDTFIYCDTDSIHLTEQIKDSNKYIIGNNLGNFAIENGYRDEQGIDHTEITKARYLGQKCYILGKMQSKNEVLVKKIAGAPAKVKEQIDWDNFKIGFTSDADEYPKFRMKNVKGGVLLIPTAFTIKEKL